MSLLQTVLHGLHVERDARFCPFAGFEMPLQYPEGLKAEHLWTRAHAGLFDVSHMGQLRVRGPDLHAALECALPVDFDGWPAGLQRYSLLLADDGGIVDDLMVTNLGEEVRIVVNASGRDKDVARLRALCPTLHFELLDAALVAVQGPSAEAVLAAVRPEIRTLAFMRTSCLEIDGARCLVSRSGYTGEDGFEISIPTEHAGRIVRRLLADPEVRPIGLGARDTLRLEAALPLYGQDMDASTSPIEAGLAAAVARSRREGGVKAGGFPGAERIFRESREGVPRRFGGFMGVEAVPIRTGTVLADTSGRPLGDVTSGTVSPVLNRPIMLGYLASGVLPDVALTAIVRNQARPVVRASLPFVPKRYKRTP